MAKKVTDSSNKLFLEYTRSKPIAFIPFLAKVADSANAGLFMSQMLFWWGKGRKEGWIYKTIEEFKEETTLSRHEQDTAIRKWKKLGVIKTKLEGIPPKRHFQINTEKLKRVVDEALMKLDLPKNG